MTPRQSWGAGGGYFNHLHSTEEETQVQSGYIIYPRSHKNAGMRPGSSDSVLSTVTVQIDSFESSTWGESGMAPASSTLWELGLWLSSRMQARFGVPSPTMGSKTLKRHGASALWLGSCSQAS